MPTFEFTSPDGKKYSVDGPAGATKEQAFQVLQAQLQGGRVNPQIDGVPGADPSMLDGSRNVGQPDSRSLGDKIKGAGEAALSLASGATTGALGMLGGTVKGLAGSILDGTFGTQQGVQQVEQAAGQGAEALTYAPRTEAGQDYAGAVGGALAAALPATALTGEMGALARGVSSARGAITDLAAATNAPLNAADAALAAVPKTPLRDLVRKPASTMSGVGAAATSKAAIRADRFQRLGINPTEGQLTRDKPQMKFEREIAKKEEGKAVSDHFDEQNAQVERLFNEMDDNTGSQAVLPYDKGEIVANAVGAKAAAKKAEANAAYSEARDAGELMEPVDVTSLVSFVKANKGKDRMAPIVSMIESEIEQNGQKVGGNLDKLTLTPTPKRVTMTLDAAEDLRQAINDFAEPGTPNMPMGIKAIRVLDKATEGKGGELYKAARKKWADYSREFTDNGLINNLLRTKRGTTDRVVPFEKVFDHLIVNGDQDSVKHVFKVLEDMPATIDPAIAEAGQQAAAELRGALINHIKEKMFSNGGADTAGNVVGSQKKVLDTVTRLDRKGILEAALGKEDAQKLRDIRDAAVDIYTTPGGVVNTSGNEGAIVAAIEKLAKNTPPIPGIKHAANYAAEQARNRALEKRIERALNPGKAKTKPAKNNF